MRVCVSAFFFFFFTRFKPNFVTVHSLLRLLFINSSRKVWLFPHFQHKFYSLLTHKFHFSTTFSLKMSLTILFTYLKIILLQCFLVFNFNFQFSAVSKQTLSQCYQCFQWKRKRFSKKRKRKKKKKKRKEKESQLTFLEKMKKSALGARC